MLEWYSDSAEARWDASGHQKARVLAVSRDNQAVSGSGNLHGIVNKEMTTVSTLPCGRLLKPRRDLGAFLKNSFPK